MLCAECDRCRRRSILSPKESQAGSPLVAGPGADAARLRCDLCGSRRVRLVRFASMFEAVGFVTGRLSGK